MKIIWKTYAETAEMAENRGVQMFLEAFFRYLPLGLLDPDLHAWKPEGSPSTLGRALAEKLTTAVRDQRRQLETLQYEVSRLKRDLESRTRILSWYQENPLQEQVKKLRDELKLETERAEKAERKLASAELRLRSERQQHVDDLERLEQKVADQKVLIGKYHNRLMELTGNDL